MERRATFNQAAKMYDETRPSYPDEVIDWIINKTNISTDAKLLEIGAGTGQATSKFAERGYAVHCIEMGENLADVLIQKLGHYDVRVDVCPFEKWVPEKNFRTPLIFCATAFHWIDKSIKYKKCYELLDQDGYLVLIWNGSSDTSIPEVKKSYEYLWEYYPDRASDTTTMEDLKNGRKDEIAESGYFELVDYLDYNWKFKQSKEKFTEGFFAQSSYLALDEEQRKALSAKIHELYAGLNEIVETDFYTTVYIAKKVQHISQNKTR